MPTVSCTSCGQAIDLPAGFNRAKIRCVGCGYYADVPSAQRGPAEPQPDAPSPAAGRATPAAARSDAEDSGLTPTAGYDPLQEETFGLAAPLAPPPTPSPPTKSKPRARLAQAKPQRNPLDHRPEFEPEENAPDAPLLPGTQDEDDDQPYAVPGVGLKHCPHCKGQLPLRAEFCVHCGRDLATGEKAKKVYQPIFREWEEGYPLTTRLYVLAGFQVLNVFFAVVAFIAQDLSFRDYGAIVANMFFGVVQLALQAFLVGTFDTLQVDRNAKGQATITRIRRIAFFPLPPMKIAWKEHTYVGVLGTHDPGFFSWMTCVYLLMLGCVPGMLFYWFVIRPERFAVSLANEYASPELTLFRTTNRDLACDIAELLGECTKLKFKQVL